MTGPKVLVLGWIGSTNLGDELIAEEICRMLVDAGCRPSVATIDTESSARFGVPMVQHAKALDTISLARTITHHDGVVFGGGGLIQDETGPLNIPFHLARLAAARILRKPWVGVGLGVGDVRRRSGKLLVRGILRNAAAISMRDKASANRHLELTGRPAIAAADPVFLTSTPAMKRSDHLVVSLRRANSAGQRRLRSTNPPDAGRVENWAQIIDAVARPHGLKVRFVAWEREQDAPLHEAVAALLWSPSILEVPDADHIVSRMGAGQIILTMRYHGAVSALLNRRPCVVLDYSPKMADLVAESGGAAALAPLDATSTQIVSMFDSIIDKSTLRNDALAGFQARAADNRLVIESLLSRIRER